MSRVIPNPAGLTAAEAASRLAAEGPNALPSAQRHGTLALALLFAMRSRERTIVDTVRQPNPALWWICAGALAALAAAIYVPFAASLFKFSPLGATELAAAAVAGIAGVAWIEIAKLRRRDTAGISP